jgi:hypothetical protein
MRPSDLDRQFDRANSQWEAGLLRSAFRLFLNAAKAGDPGFSSTVSAMKSDRGMPWHGLVEQ